MSVVEDSFCILDAGWLELELEDGEAVRTVDVILRFNCGLSVL